MLMGDGAVPIKSRTVDTDDGTFAIILIGGDLSRIYPGMQRYIVEIHRGAEIVYRYALNSYEQPPGTLFDAGEVAEIVFARLAYDVAARPERYLKPVPSATMRLPGAAHDVVVLQGSGAPAVSATWPSSRAGAPTRPHGSGSRPAPSTCRRCGSPRASGAMPVTTSVPVPSKTTPCDRAGIRSDDLVRRSTQTPSRRV